MLRPLEHNSIPPADPVGYGIRYISDCSCSKEQTASGDSQSETAAAIIRQSQHAIFAKVVKIYPGEERRRLSKRSRQREIGTGRRFALGVRDRTLLLLFYYRTYATQDVAAEVFGVGQAAVSRSIEQIAPVVKKCVPIPAKLYARSKRVSAVEEPEELFPRLVALVDASEQPIQRPKRKDMEKSHYSGKAGRHTVKTQYTVNVHGLIIHNIRHSPGCVHDFKVYKTKHPTFPKNLPSRDGSTRVSVHHI